MKTALTALIFASIPLNAAAFLFGGTSDKKAVDLIGVMAAGFAAGDCPAVVEISGELLGEKPPPEIKEKAYSYLGRCYESQGLADKAITMYKLAHGLYPENRFFPARLAAIYLRSGFYDLAVPLFEEALRDRPDDIQANAGLARSYASMGFLSKAKTYYSRAVILGEFGNLTLMKEYIGWMLKKRDWEETELIAGYAGKLAPEDAQLSEALARVAAGRGDHKQAALKMREAVSLAPSDTALALELALTEFLAGDYDAALASVPVRERESNALALVIRGMALRKKGDMPGSLECFRKASDIGGRSFVAAFAAALAGPGGKNAH